MAVDPGKAPELAWLPVDRLTVDHRYQRTLESRTSRQLIDRIADNFRWAAFQAILAAPQGSGWVLVDGQHRVAAAKRIGIEHVPAVVIEAASVAEQAAAFASANADRVRVNDFTLHRAKLAAGDEGAKRIEAMAKEAGIKIPTSQPGKGHPQAPGTTMALGAFRLLPQRYGDAVARIAFSAVADAYRAEVGGLRALLFDAACKLQQIERRPDRAAITAALSRSTAAALWADIHIRAAKTRESRLSCAVAIIGDRLSMPAPAQAAAARLAPAPATPPASQSLPRPASATPAQVPAFKHGALPPTRREGESREAWQRRIAGKFATA